MPTGLWADPLVPDVDVYVGEKRNAFPLAVPPRQSRFVWIDVFVPTNAKTGTTSHSVTVKGSGGFAAQLQLKLTVFDFALPTAPSMSSIFGLGANWGWLAAVHKTSSDAETAALVQRYVKCGLMNRVSFADFLGYGGPQMQADAGGNGSFARFVSEWGELIDGVALPFGPR